MVFILNTVTPAILDIIQLLLQFNAICILKLINGNSNDLEKLHTYLKGTTAFTSLNFLLAPSAVDSPKRLDLYLKDVELSVVTSGFVTTFNSSLLNCHNLAVGCAHHLCVIHIF